jgi:hypothetical protein
MSNSCIRKTLDAGEYVFQQVSPFYPHSHDPVIPILTYIPTIPTGRPSHGPVRDRGGQREHREGAGDRLQEQVSTGKPLSQPVLLRAV